MALRQVLLTITQGGGDSTEVAAESLRYDRPEVFPIPTTGQGLGVGTDETAPLPTLEEIAAALFLATEPVPVPSITDVAEATVTDQVTVPVPILEHAVGAEVDQTETVTPPTETFDLTLTTDEPVPALTELVNIEGTVTEVTVLPTPSIADSAGAMVSEVVSTIGDTCVTVASVATSPNATVSNTGWTTPENFNDFDDDEAMLSAASSGSLNTTSNTTNGTLVAGFPDFTLTSGATLTSVVLSIYTRSSSSAMSGQQYNISLQYSLDNGDTWTTITTLTSPWTNAATPITVDLTSAVGNDLTKINGLRVRATGSVTSGIGTSVVQGVTRAFLSKARLTFTATKTE